MLYKSGEKGLSVIGFTKLARLNRAYIVDDKCHIVVPSKKDPVRHFLLS